MEGDYYRISAEELGQNARIPVCKLGDVGEVFCELAVEMVRGIRANNAAGKNTVYIVPVGPIGQYPIFVRLVNRERLSLKNCWFINMDEYLTPDGRWLDSGDSLSFRGFMNRAVYKCLEPELVMPEEQRIFPNPDDPGRVTWLIEELGGVDAVFGGVGVNGHIAFNEAIDGMSAEDFAALPTRVLELSRETIAANGICDLNGALDRIPRQAITVGMREILGAKRIRIAMIKPWHPAGVRRAAYGEVSAEFPVSLLQRHPDAMLLINAATAKIPF